MAGAGGIGGYEIGAPIREGWGGTIRAGQYRRSGRRVTVQDVRPDLTASPGLVARLSDLGREAATVRDPHLLAVYDLVEESPAFRLIAEWSDGASVAQTLRRGSLRPPQAVAVVLDVLAGLEALHAHGLFHGHVGPETVVVDGDGRGRLAELALCAAAAPPGFGPHTDVRDAARLGVHLLRKAGSGFDPLRRALEGAATAGGAVEAGALRSELDSGATALLGPGWRDRLSGPSRHRRGDGRRKRWPVVVAVTVLVVAAITAGIVLITRPGAATPAGPLTLGNDATLVVTPVSGGCNTTFTFVGRGSLSGAGTMVYRWEQSDGQVSADTSLPITSDEGSFQLTQVWRLQGSQKVDGTMTLHVLKPQDRRLAQTFHYNCP